MTDKKLIQTLRSCQKAGSCLSCEAFTQCRGLEELQGQAANRLESLLAENERLTIELQAMRNAANGYKKLVPKCVSVKERLPNILDFTTPGHGTRMEPSMTLRGLSPTGCRCPAVRGWSEWLYVADVGDRIPHIRCFQRNHVSRLLL